MTGNKPILVEPEQHYWRRKANRRVRKARLTRSLRRWSAIATALAIIGVSLFQAGAHAVERFRHVEGLAIEHIEVEGAHRSGSQAIEARLQVYLGRNIVDLNLYEVVATAQTDPWVLAASAKRVLPRTLVVTVTERQPTAVAIIEKAPYVVDATGFVTGRLEAGGFEELPVIRGLDGMSREELVVALRRGVGSIARLRATAGAWVGEIAEIDFSRPDRIVVRTVDPGPEILLDPRRVDRNVNRYLELRREIARGAGPLVYVDLRWQDRISVMPAVNFPRMEGG